MTEKLIATGLGDYIYKKHIRTSGKGAAWWSNRVGVIGSEFRNLLENRRAIAVSTILRVARHFGDAPHTYIRLQNEFFLNKILIEESKSKTFRVIPKVNVRERSLHGVLKERLFSKDMTKEDLASKMKIQLSTLDNYFSHSSRHRPMNYVNAGKLGEALGTGPRLWLDLLSEWHLKRYLNKNPYMCKYFDLERLSQRTRIRASEILNVVPPNPGRELDDCFLKPSGIRKEYWSNYFCVSRHTLKSIINGESLMKFNFVARLVKAFNVSACDWIEMQNDYLAHKYISSGPRRLKINAFESTPRLAKCDMVHHPGNILWSNFMVPMNLSAVALAEHLGVLNGTIYDLIKGRVGMSYSLAIKLAQAFDTIPMFWMDLQMHYELNLWALERSKHGWRL